MILESHISAWQDSQYFIDCCGICGTLPSWVDLCHDSFMGLDATIALQADARWAKRRLKCPRWACQELATDDALHLEAALKCNKANHKQQIPMGRHWQAGAVMAGKILDDSGKPQFLARLTNFIDCSRACGTHQSWVDLCHD